MVLCVFKLIIQLHFRSYFALHMEIHKTAFNKQNKVIYKISYLLDDPIGSVPKAN